MQKTDQTASNNHTTETRVLNFALFATLCLLLIGLFAPILTLKKFVLVENTFSVIGGAIALFREGKLFLFLVITAFSVVLPLLKIGVLAKLLNSLSHSAKLKRYLHWLHLYGKWSMLDVFVVAILVVVVKLGVIASVEMRYGLYAFAAAVLLTMLITARVVKLSDKRSAERKLK